MNVYDKRGLVPKVQNNNISNILSNHLNNTSKISEIKILDNFQSVNSQTTYRSEKQFRSTTNSQKENTKILNKSLKSQSQKCDITFDDIDNLTLSKEEVYRIHQKFQILYINRLSSEKTTQQTQQSLTASKDFENRSKSPRLISQKSEILAQSKREKLLHEVKQREPQRTTIDLASLLSYQKEKTKIEIEQIRKKNIEEELTQCTFKPQTALNSPLQRKMSQQTQNYDSIFNKKNSVPNLYVHRSHHLHYLAKPQINKRDRDIREIDYEKNCDQCTFQPDTNLKRANSPNIKPQSPYNMHSIQKNVDRLYSARVQNKVKEILSMQGTTFNKKKLKQVQDNIQKSIKQPQLNPSVQNWVAQNDNNEIGSDKYLQSFTSLFQSKQKSLPSLIPNKSNFKQEKDDVSVGVCSPQMSSLNDCLSSDSLYTYVNPSSSKKIVEQEERVPQLFVDVNIEEGKSARIIVYEGDKSEELSSEFARQFDLDESMRLKLKDLLDMQINSLLHKIEEASANEDEEEDDIDQLMYSRSGSKSKSRIVV